MDGISNGKNPFIFLLGSGAHGMVSFPSSTLRCTLPTLPLDHQHYSLSAANKTSARNDNVPELTVLDSASTHDDPDRLLDFL